MSENAVGIGILGFGGFAAPAHERTIAEDNGRESLRMSVRPSELSLETMKATPVEHV